MTEPAKDCHDPDDYALFRKQLAKAREDLTEAHALIRDMVPHLRPPSYDCPGHLQFRRVIAGLRKRADDFNRKAGAA